MFRQLPDHTQLASGGLGVIGEIRPAELHNRKLPVANDRCVSVPDFGEEPVRDSENYTAQVSS